MAEGKVIQGLDVIDLIVVVGQKNKKFTAIALQEIEEILGKDSEEYKSIRKVFLDSFNNYTRSVMRSIFGDDFEYIKHA